MVRIGLGVIRNGLRRARLGLVEVELNSVRLGGARV